MCATAAVHSAFIPPRSASSQSKAREGQDLLPSDASLVAVTKRSNVTSVAKICWFFLNSIYYEHLIALNLPASGNRF